MYSEIKFFLAIFAVLVLAGAFLVSPFLALANHDAENNGNGFELPPGEPITKKTIDVFITDTANFLITVGVIGAVITLVISGIMYFTAGAKPDQATKAKTIFKNGLYGTAIILAVGVIINTIAGLISGDFFGGNDQQDSSPRQATISRGAIGWACVRDRECNSGLKCNDGPLLDGGSNKICVSRSGNREGDWCTLTEDCRSGLACADVNQRAGSVTLGKCKKTTKTFGE